MVHGRSEVEAEVPQRLSIISYLSAALSVRFCVHMQLRSAAQRAQRSAKSRTAIHAHIVRGVLRSLATRACRSGRRQATTVVTRHACGGRVATAVPRRANCEWFWAP